MQSLIILFEGKKRYQDFTSTSRHRTLDTGKLLLKLFFLIQCEIFFLIFFLFEKWEECKLLISRFKLINVLT